MKIIIAIILAGIFLLLSGLHFYWGVGGKWGMASAVPTIDNKKKVINPGPFECFLVAFGLMGFGILVLCKVGILFILPGWLDRYGLWIIFFIFVLRAIGDFRYVGFFKKNKQTRFAHKDTQLYSPLCLLIATLVVILQLWN